MSPIEIWTRIALEPSGPSDRAVAAAAVRDIYEEAGYGPPAVLFCSSPAALALTLELVRMRAMRHETRGRRRYPMDRPSKGRRAAASRHIARLSREHWLDVVRNVREAPLFHGLETFSHEGRYGGLFPAFHLRDSRARRTSAVDYLRGHVGAHRPGEALERMAAGPIRTLQRIDCVRAALYEELAGVRKPGLRRYVELAGGPALPSQAALARAGGVAVFMRHVVLISDRHVEPLKLDAEGRLHCDDGPAVVYPDGEGLYALHGVAVPRAVVEKPVTLDAIEMEENLEVRRVMIDRYGGLERFLADVGVEEIQSDETGVLVRHYWPARGRGALTAVRVRNSTPEPDGSRREYLLQVPRWTQTAREGVAWTFGLQPREYKPVVET